MLQASSTAAARLGLLFAQSKWLLGEHRLAKAGRTDDLEILFSLMGISSSFDKHFAAKPAVIAHICKVSHCCCPLIRVSRPVSTVVSNDGTLCPRNWLQELIIEPV